MKKIKSNNKKRTVEIYFILYLAALVLLISKTNRNNDIGNDNIQHKNFDLPFILKAEKPMLTCKVWVDSLGQQCYELDSINYIWNAGEVEDIRYDFVVEDKEQNNSMHLTGNEEYESRVFEFVEDKDNNMAVFRWHPNIYIYENKTYIVYVSATAKLINSKNKQRVKAKTQFSLVVSCLDNNQPNYNNEPFVDTNQYNYVVQERLSYQNFQNNAVNNTGELNLFTSPSKIKGIAFQEWESKVFCMGANLKTDLTSVPKIEIKNTPSNNNGTARIVSYSDNTIILKGKVPAFGSSKVFVTIERKNDLKEATISFEVLPQDIEAPIYPKIMYPEQTYVFNPKLPLNIGNARAVLKTEGNKIRAENYQGGIIEFKPFQNDTGKVFVFERYINDVLIGAAINIKVIPNEKPIITRIAEKDKSVVINVSSHGWYNGKENRIKKLDLTGNARYKPLYGKISVDRAAAKWHEQFEIFPVDERQPFTFTVVAVDNMGMTSQKETYK